MKRSKENEKFILCPLSKKVFLYLTPLCIAELGYILYYVSKVPENEMIFTKNLIVSMLESVAAGLALIVGGALLADAVEKKR